MKRIASIGLIFLMSFQCLYQLGVITYFEANRDYIAEVLCVNRENPIKMCHGRCFLERNLSLADGASTDESTPPPATQKADFPIFLVTENRYSFQQFIPLETYNSRYLLYPSTAHHQALFRPPAVLA